MFSEEKLVFCFHKKMATDIFGMLIAGLVHHATHSNYLYKLKNVNIDFYIIEYQYFIN